MRRSGGNNAGWSTNSGARARELALVRPAMLVAICLVAAVALGAVWFHRRTAHRGTEMSEAASGGGQVTLSDGTMAVLHRLDAPLEIRFYSVLDPAAGPDSLQAFAGRIDQLLSAYQQAAGGKIRLVRYNYSRSGFKTVADAAAADGIRRFNLGKGDDCYLGLAVIHKGQRESFPQLSPEWEQALEPDLSRAIARLINAPSAVEATAAVSQIDPAIAAEVKRQIPNLTSVSLEEGTRLLRESALKDFQAMASEIQTQIKEAEQRVSQAQSGGSEAERQAALKQLQQVQADQVEKLRQIITKSSAKIEALRQLKAPGK